MASFLKFPKGVTILLSDPVCLTIATQNIFVLGSPDPLMDITWHWREDIVFEDD